MGMGLAQCISPYGWVLGCSLLYLLESWIPSGLAFIPTGHHYYPALQRGPGCGYGKNWVILLHLGRGNLVAAIPTLAWQLHRSLSPNPDLMWVPCTEVTMALVVVCWSLSP